MLLIYNFDFFLNNQKLDQVSSIFSFKEFNSIQYSNPKNSASQKNGSVV